MASPSYSNGAGDGYSSFFVMVSFTKGLHKECLLWRARAERFYADIGLTRTLCPEKLQVFNGKLLMQLQAVFPQDATF